LIKAKKIPMRMCLGCREMKPKKDLIRIVMNKEGSIQLDFTGKAQGRGAYICKSRTCASKLKKARGIEKNFGCQIPVEIYEGIEKELSDSE